MRFLVDAQLPPALARWLESQGYTAEHVADTQMAGASDVAIWEQAVEKGAVIVTKDEDFAIWQTQATGQNPQLFGSEWATHVRRIFYSGWSASCHPSFGNWNGVKR